MDGGIRNILLRKIYYIGFLIGLIARKVRRRSLQDVASVRELILSGHLGGFSNGFRAILEDMLYDFVG